MFIARSGSSRERLFEEHRDFAEHGGIGLITHHLLNVFQLFDLANHLPEALIVVDQQPDAALVAVLNRQSKNAFHVESAAGKQAANVGHHARVVAHGEL